MLKKQRVLLLLSCIVLVLIAIFFSVYKTTVPTGKKSIADIKTSADLAEHSKIFKKGVEKVKGTNNIYVAIGFGLANSIMIEGKDGLIIVDTMESKEVAANVLSEFRKITQKPIKAIIYTHNHADHIFGAEVFAAEGNPEVYAHETTLYYVNRMLNKMRPSIGVRAMRMFGNFLNKEGLVNAGIGPHLSIGPESTVGFVHPTRTFSDTLEAEVAGIKFKLVHAPGETNDHLFVWLPEQKVLMPGDNFYWTFPNLYTIRGTPFRSLQQWYQSIDKMRDFNPVVLIPSHSRPIVGSEKIQKILTNYRDAIQFIHDQSIRGMNMGMTHDELAEYVVLPPHLRSLPYLQEFYGKSSWSARSMFSGNLGWFDGDSAKLQPLTRLKQAELIARIAGGEAELMKHAREALKNGEYQAALQLTGHLVRLKPNNQQAKDIRVKALIALGEREENPNARHYYLTEALEIRDGFVARETARPTPKLLHDFPLKGYFELLAVNLNPKASADVNKIVGMKFPDINRGYTIHVRHSVAEIRPRSPEEIDRMELDIKVIAGSKAWKEMLGKIRNSVITLASFEYEKGNTLAFASFLRMFEPVEPKLPYEPAKK
ncbi:MAG: MBL fold metallo-hydrolase [Desulfobacteraceae bacterium]|nr:MBL fold metallo-hydrolase [Desulfobacteraceae bacterium]